MKIFTFTAVLLLPALITAAVDIFLLSDSKKIKNIIGSFTKYFFVLNIFTFSAAKFLIKSENIFFANMRSYTYFAKFFVTSMAVGIFMLLIKGFLTKKLCLVKAEPKHKGGALTLRIFATIFFILGVAAFTGTIWGKEQFHDVNPDQMLVTLLSPTTGTDSSIMTTALEGPVLQTAFLTTIFSIFNFSKFHFVYKAKEKAITLVNELAFRIICFILAICTLAGGITFGIKKFDLVKIAEAYLDESPYIEDNYKDPAKVSLQFPQKKRNLIHIYLESIENSYLDKKQGGFMRKSLMPRLAKLSREGICFSHKGEGQGLGGPLKTYGSTWSVASMVSQSFGFPMKVPVDGNAYGTPGHFFPGAVGIGDILQKMGYNQTLMFGADSDFGGLTHMFNDHGAFKIMDYKFALKSGMLPKDYKESWGYEDDKLYEFAKTELTRLSQEDQPFYFVMENADSHFPGYIGKNTEIKYDSQYANAIAYTDKKMDEFIRWVQAQPFYENTTIVMIGDHLSMDKVFFEEHGFKGSGYLRTTYSLILNPSPEVSGIDKSRTFNRQYGNFDMFPTVLASIGVKIDGNRLALGTNLFSNEPTLFERDDYQYVNDQFVKRSNYYNNNFLLGKSTYKGDNLSTY